MSLETRIIAFVQAIGADIKALLARNDYTTTEKGKLAGIASGAQVNAVTLVAGRSGAVALAKADVGLASIDNTSDVNKPISNAQAVAFADADIKLWLGV